MTDKRVLISPEKSSHALGPGVFGYSVDTPEGLYIPVVQAEHPGRGDVGRWLDSLPTDRRIVFASVFSPKLAGMLERRGWTFVEEYNPRAREHVPCWERGVRVMLVGAIDVPLSTERPLPTGPRTDVAP